MSNKDTEVKEKKCFWHLWNKWEDMYISENEHIHIRQIKSCKKCNKKKGRSITYVKKIR